MANFLSRDMMYPAATANMLWRGIIAMGLVASVLVTMFLRHGALLKPYATFLGGASVVVLFKTAPRLTRGAAFTYILAGLPLAIPAWHIEWLYRRRSVWI